MSKKLVFITFIALFLIACGGNQAINSNINSNIAASGGNINTNVNVANTATNVNSNVNSKPAVNNSPKRMSFGKGQNWGSSNITLPAGGTQKFIVSAKSGQIMDVEVSSKETSVNLIKGKAQTTEDFGYLNAELQTNGDYVFEVKNSTKKEIKTSVKVTIKGGEKIKDINKKDAESEIDESDSTVADDDDVLPPPTETPKKKGNLNYE